MDLQNNEALQIVSSFNLGLNDLFESTDVREDDITVHLDGIGKENVATMRLMLPKLNSSSRKVLQKQLRTKVRKIDFKSCALHNPTDLHHIHQIPPSGVSLSTIGNEFFRPLAPKLI